MTTIKTFTLDEAAKKTAQAKKVSAPTNNTLGTSEISARVPAKINVPSGVKTFKISDIKKTASQHTATKKSPVKVDSEGNVVGSWNSDEKSTTNISTPVVEKQPELKNTTHFSAVHDDLIGKGYKHVKDTTSGPNTRSYYNHDTDGKLTVHHKDGEVQLAVRPGGVKVDVDHLNPNPKKSPSLDIKPATEAPKANLEPVKPEAETTPEHELNPEPISNSFSKDKIAPKLSAYHDVLSKNGFKNTSSLNAPDPNGNNELVHHYSHPDGQTATIHIDTTNKGNVSKAYVRHPDQENGNKITAFDSEHTLLNPNRVGYNKEIDNSHKSTSSLTGNHSSTSLSLGPKEEPTRFQKLMSTIKGSKTLDASSVESNGVPMPKKYKQERDAEDFANRDKSQDFAKTKAVVSTVKKFSSFAGNAIKNKVDSIKNSDNGKLIASVPGHIKAYNGVKTEIKKGMDNGLPPVESNHSVNNLNPKISQDHNLSLSVAPKNNIDTNEIKTKVKTFQANKPKPISSSGNGEGSLSSTLKPTSQTASIGKVPTVLKSPVSVAADSLNGGSGAKIQTSDTSLPKPDAGKAIASAQKTFKPNITSNARRDINKDTEVNKTTGRRKTFNPSI